MTEILPQFVLALLACICGAASAFNPALFQNQEQLPRHMQVFTLATATNNGRVPNTGISTSPLTINLDAIRLFRNSGRSEANSPHGPTQHTLDHRNCPACEQETLEATLPHTLASLPFPVAAKRWLWEHSRFIEQRTVNDYRSRIRLLTKFFGSLLLKEITIGHIRVYQKSRAMRVCNVMVNTELSCLHQVLEFANLWHPMASMYRALPVNREGSGQCWTPEEKEVMLKTALHPKHTRWHVAGHCINVMLNTGCGFGELRQLRRSDYDVGERTIFVLMGAKNAYRRRKVPLNEPAQASMLWLLERFEDYGGKESDQYILFHRSPNKLGPDFSRPMSSIKNAFYSIRRKAKLPPKRLYDCRVTAITETLSSGDVSLHTAEKLFGHVGKAMQRRYYKPDIEVLRKATNRLEPKRGPENVRRVWGWTNGTSG